MRGGCRPYIRHGAGRLCGGAQAACAAVCRPLVLWGAGRLCCCIPIKRVPRQLRSLAPARRCPGAACVAAGRLCAISSLEKHKRTV